MRRIAIYVGPTCVKEAARRLEAAGIPVMTEGTERVWVETTLDNETVLKAIGMGCTWRDVEEIGYNLYSRYQYAASPQS